MKIGKPKSKRVPVRLRHKIEKRSASKQRKERKDAKKNPQWKSRLKKDPGIPNLFPYKAKVLAEIEESQRRKQEEKLQRQEQARARREGRAVDVSAVRTADEDEDDEDESMEEGGAALPAGDEDEEMDYDDRNPMAALLASAQKRAQQFGVSDGGGDLEEDSENDEDEDIEGEWTGIGETKKQIAAQQKKTLPKQALEDPVKAVSLLMARLEDTMGAVEAMLNHYELPPLVTAGSDASSRFLVEVARKRGRLGRGGIPNLHSAALIVLSDLHEERLQLPTASSATTVQSAAADDKTEITIVKTMAAPFKLEGLWG